MTWPIKHLTADDLDAFHSASLSVEDQKHLEECEDCRALVQQDSALLAALASLPRFEPSSGFADRVMARVEPARAGGAVVPLLRRRRLAIAATLAVSLGASVVWSWFNRDLLLSWLNQSAAAVGSTMWTAVRVAAVNLTEQSWFAGLADFASSSGRLALAAGGLLVGYGAALFGLKRLLVPPSRPVPDVQG